MTLTREKVVDLFVRSWLDECREQFDQSHNPFYAWEAFDVCIRHKLRVPIWISKYLRQCAGRIAAMDTSSEDYRKALAQAIGAESATCYSEFRNFVQQLQIAMDVHEAERSMRSKYSKVPLDGIFESVAKAQNPEVSKSTVRNYYLARKEMLDNWIAEGESFKELRRELKK